MTESKKYVVALDQGTTSSRAVLYDLSGNELKIASRPLSVHFPKEAWVEQDADEIWSTQLAALQEVAVGVEDQIVALGITNQRETTIAWSRKTGKALAPAVVWQCRRSAEICADLRSQNLSNVIVDRTGLVIDSYFSGSKILWLQRNVPGLTDLVRSGEAVFGTVDSWLVYRLSGGKCLRTDPSNASRTMLFSLLTGDWDDELLRLFEISRANLCEICPSDSEFAVTTVLGAEVPVRAVLGDQQASLFGQRCWEPESSKCTFGTGAFMLVNTGRDVRRSSSGLLSTVAWKTRREPIEYALEGAVFVAGSLIQWLRDKLGIISDAADSESKAAQVPDSGGVVIVPAFVGLGAPHWREDVRGAIFGLTRESGAAHLARAALDGVAHQLADLLEVDELAGVREVRVDGGMCRNTLFCETLADITGRNIIRGASLEATARGAAGMALHDLRYGGDRLALKSGFFGADRGDQTFTPQISHAARAVARARWAAALSGLLRK